MSKAHDTQFYVSLESDSVSENIELQETLKSFQKENKVKLKIRENNIYAPKRTHLTRLHRVLCENAYDSNIKRGNKTVRSSISYLIENQLEKVEIVLAAKDVIDKLQGMAEDVAKIQANDLMPLIDEIQQSFGSDISKDFQTLAFDSLMEVMDTIRKAKESMNSKIISLEQSAGCDMANDDGSLDQATDELTDALGDSAADLDTEADEEPATDDDFEASDAASGGDEPLGREKKKDTEEKELKESEEIEEDDLDEDDLDERDLNHSVRRLARHARRRSRR